MSSEPKPSRLKFSGSVFRPSIAARGRLVNARALATTEEEEPIMLGFVEVILLLLGLSNVGLQANPNPPTADASLQYAMADADIVLHVDAATFVPNNYKVLMQLGNQPQIKASPELSKLVREAVAEIDGMRGRA